MRILRCSHLPLSVRVEAFFHMTNPITCTLGLIVLLVSPPMVLLHDKLSTLLVLFTFLPSLTVLVSGVITCFVKVPGSNGHYSTFWSRAKRLVYIPLVLCLAMGTSIYDTRAILQGIFSNDSTFLRTPKSGDDAAAFNLFESQNQEEDKKGKSVASKKESEKTSFLGRCHKFLTDEETKQTASDTFFALLGIFIGFYLLVIPYMDIFIWAKDAPDTPYCQYLLPMCFIFPATALICKFFYSTSVPAGLHRSSCSLFVIKCITERYLLKWISPCSIPRCWDLQN